MSVQDETYGTKGVLVAVLIYTAQPPRSLASQSEMATVELVETPMLPLTPIVL